MVLNPYEQNAQEELYWFVTCWAQGCPSRLIPFRVSSTQKPYMGEGIYLVHADAITGSGCGKSFVTGTFGYEGPYPACGRPAFVDNSTPDGIPDISMIPTIAYMCPIHPWYGSVDPGDHIEMLIEGMKCADCDWTFPGQDSHNGIVVFSYSAPTHYRVQGEIVSEFACHCGLLEPVYGNCGQTLVPYR